jgi:hypothetical protein
LKSYYSRLFNRHKIHKSKFYWRFLQRKNNLLFRLRRTYFSYLRLKKEHIDKGSVLGSFISQSIWAIFRLAMFAFLLYFIERITNHYWYTYKNSVPIWLQRFVDFIPKPTYPDNKDQIIELNSVIASVSGIVLALFYPVLATIASTAYAKVHSNIRNLLFNEKTIKGYLQNLTRLTAFAVFNLFALSFGFYPGNLVLTVLFVYALVMLYNILKIGFGVYNLFDPSALMNSVQLDLVKNIQEATIKGHFWSDPAFQTFYHNNSKSRLEEIRTLVNLCDKDDQLNEIAYKKIAGGSFVIFNLYLNLKAQIPISSSWYPKTRIHKSLLEHSDINRDIFGSLMTNISTEGITDYNWFETSIIKIFLEEKSNSNNLHSSERLKIGIGLVQIILPTLGQLGEIETANKLLKQLNDGVRSLTTQKEELEDYELYKDKFLLVDLYFTDIMQYVWSVFSKLEEFNHEQLEKEINKIDWQKKDSLYNTSLYPSIFIELEKFVNRINMEYQVEGKGVTPQWFLAQEISFMYLIKGGATAESGIFTLEEHLLKVAQRLNQSGQHLLASNFILRGLELNYKIKIKLRGSKAAFESILTNFKKSKNANWKLFDFSQAEQRLDTIEKELHRSLNSTLDQLPAAKWNRNYPDLYSAAHLLTSKRLSNALSSHHVDEFKQYFKVYLSACLKSFEELKNRYENPEYNIKYASQPIMDLLDLSSLCYFYSAIYDDYQCWECCCETWDTQTKSWTEEDFLLIPHLYSVNHFGTGLPFNYQESFNRKRKLEEVIEATRFATTDKILLEYLPDRDDTGLSSWVNLEEIFLELKYFTYVKAGKSSKLIQDRRLFDACYK